MNKLFTIRDLGSNYPEVIEDKEKKEAYRKGFGFSEADTVLFLVFDLPHEHEFGRVLSQINPKDKVLIWPVDNRAREKLFVLHGEKINQINGLAVEFDSHRAADKGIIFRRDWFIPELTIPWEIVN